MLKNLGYKKQDSKTQHTKYINQSFKNTEKKPETQTKGSQFKTCEKDIPITRYHDN